MSQSKLEELDDDSNVIQSSTCKSTCTGRSLIFPSLPFSSPVDRSALKINEDFINDDDDDDKQRQDSSDLSRRSILRDQTGRLSRFLQSKTELHDLDITTPTPSIDADRVLNNDTSTHHSIFWYWRNDIISAKEHGGNLWNRTDSAVRAAIGSFTIFSILVFPHQQIFRTGKGLFYIIDRTESIFLSISSNFFFKYGLAIFLCMQI